MTRESPLGDAACTSNLLRVSECPSVQVGREISSLGEGDGRLAEAFGLVQDLRVIPAGYNCALGLRFEVYCPGRLRKAEGCCTVHTARCAMLYEHI
jgi:hypothetical protein